LSLLEIISEGVGKEMTDWNHTTIELAVDGLREHELESATADLPSE